MKNEYEKNFINGLVKMTSSFDILGLDNVQFFCYSKQSIEYLKKKTTCFEEIEDGCLAYKVSGYTIVFIEKKIENPKGFKDFIKSLANRL